MCCQEVSEVWVTPLGDGEYGSEKGSEGETATQVMLVLIEPEIREMAT